MLQPDVLCKCLIPFEKVENMKYCPHCGKEQVPFTLYGYTLPQIKKMIDFCKQHNYNVEN